MPRQRISSSSTATATATAPSDAAVASVAPGLIAALLALLVLPGWGSGAPAIDWADLPASPVQVTAQVSVVRCSELEPILCVSQEGHQGAGGVEHLAFPLGALPRVTDALDSGATARQALEVEVTATHTELAQDRAEGCPDGYAYLPDATRPALVAGERGVRSGFTVVDGDGRIVERSVTAMAISDDALQVFVAAGLTDAACIPADEGYPFTPEALAAVGPVLAQLVAHAEVPRSPHLRATLTVPVGGDGVTYDEPDGPDELAVGPSALAVDAAGTTWVVDVESQRLVRVDAEGALLPPVDLAGSGLEVLWDIDVRGDGFVVLGADRASGVPALILLDGQGAITAVHPLPASVDLAAGLSGLAVVDGAVVAELRGGVELVQVLDQDAQPVEVPVEAYHRHGRSYRVEMDGQLRGLVIDGRLVEVRVDHELVGLRWLGASPDGSAWVIVEELRTDTQGIHVDQTVRRYAADGRLLGSTRVPLGDRYTNVEQALTLTSDGTVITLQTRPTHAEVIPLPLRTRLAPLFPPAQPVVRVTAQDAVATAVALSVEAFPAGSATHVLLARDDVFADALASGGVQGMVDAPLLLTGSTALDQRVVAELRRLGAARVTVLGGDAAVTPDVVAALQAEGFAVDRVAGATRVETAVALARAHAATTSGAVLVRADGPEASQAFADALAAGALAAWHRDPVLLTPTGGLAPTVRAYLAEAGVTHVVLAGGQAAMSETVVDELQAMGISVDRAEGADRAHTAVQLAGRRDAPTGVHADRVVLVDGRTWADGLAAAALSARTDAPVLLADGGTLPPATAAYLAAAEQPPVVLCTPSVAPAACPTR